MATWPLRCSNCEFRDDYTGILTRDCPAVDIDVSDPQLVREIEVMIMDVTGTHDNPPPSRIGMAPRKLLLFRNEDKPFEKLSTAKYSLPTDPLIAGKLKPSAIEILSNGQQFVSHAIHPDTGAPYVWNGGGDPRILARAKLPPLSVDQAVDIVRLAGQILQRVGKASGKARIQAAPSERRPGAKLTADDPALLRDALSTLPNGDADFDDWILMLYAVKAALGADGLDDFLTWSRKSKKHDEANRVREFRAAKPQLRGAGSIFWLAAANGWKNNKKDDSPLSADDFYAYMPMHSYIFAPVGEMWPGTSVNQRVSIQGWKSATEFLDQQRSVEQMTWCPGLPQVVADRLVLKGGWFARIGCNTFNLYRPPTVLAGVANDVEPWLAHVVRLCGEGADHVIRWFAQRVQTPHIKINHALVIGGDQGVGKDSLLEPIRLAVGDWNFSEVSPSQLLGRFNSFLKSVVLRVSEARDMGDHDRYALYEHMKAIIAAPPEVLRCDEKNIREHDVFNLLGVVITTNHRDGLYLPPDDRRHYVVWSDLTRESFEQDYFQKLHRWYARGGGSVNVAQYLRTLDISDFDAKAPPPKTEAWHVMVNTGRSPEDAELADVLDACGLPDAVTLDRLTASASGIGRYDFAGFLSDRKNRKSVFYRLEAADYVPVRNRDAADGLWRIQGKRQVAYAQRQLSERDRLAAVRKLIT